jgi:hypothetical protein
VQYELANVAGFGLRVRWQLTPSSAVRWLDGWCLPGPALGGRREDRGRERERYADESRQSQDYVMEKLCVDHLKPPW